MRTAKAPPRSTREGLTRRDWLRVGGLHFFGLTLPALLGGRARAEARRRPALPGFGRARSCLLIFLKGGPSHLDTFDMKPDAPDAVRGEFRTVATAAPGVRLCEHLPALAR